MKLILFILGLVVLALAFFQPVAGQQQDTAFQRFVYMDRLVGIWHGREEVREGPDQEWEHGTSDWEVRWLPGKYLAETSGQLIIGDRTISWTQLWGFDPRVESMVSWYGNDRGSVGTVTSAGWNGTTFTMNFTESTPSGETVIGRGTWEHSPDFKSVRGTFDRFSEGRWWTFRQVTAEKTKKVQSEVKKP
jgi:hypothetical protein